MKISSIFDPSTVCWIEVKVAVLCAHQYMPWNLLLIKVLNNFWYFKHQILTRICSEAYLKHYWRNCLLLIVFFLLFSKTNLQLCFKHASEQILVDVWCLKYQKSFKTMIRSRFHGMYWHAHKTATLTSFQHTVPPTVCSNGFYADIWSQHQVQQYKLCLKSFL